jgi:hypothetical protein
MALGAGISLATVLKPVTNSFSSMAFIGLPCPMKSTGIVSVLLNDESLFNVLAFIIPLFLTIKLIKISGN